MDNNLLIPNFKKSNDLLCAMSQREDGNMKLYNETVTDTGTLINRKRFLNKLGIPDDQVVSVKSIHGSNVEIVTEEDRGSFIENTDGLMTDRKEVFLSITVADCLPVIIFDPLEKVLGLLHCGWKGLENRIIKTAVDKMIKNFNVDPENIVAGIGPGIGSCHYEVTEDFLIRFRSYPEIIQKRNNLYYIDLKLLTKLQLEECAVKSGKIWTSPDCTYCQSKRYFSYRKDKSRPVRAMIFVAGMKYI